MNDILKPLIRQFLPFAQERMGFKDPPRLFLRQDAENAINPLGKTAFYDPQARSIVLYVSGRHPKDIMRSLSHELVHHTQNCNGEFDHETEMGEGYAQTNPHLRQMEIAANRDGNMCFRDWEDSIKGTIYNEHLHKGVNEPMSTKNWKNGEIKTLLTEKWGFKFNLDHLNEDCNCSDGDVVEEAEEEAVVEEKTEEITEICPDTMHGDEEGEVVAVDAMEEAPEARAMELVDELRDIIAQLTGGDVGRAGDEGAIEELEETKIDEADVEDVEESKKKKVDEQMVRRIIRKALKNNMAKRK